MLQCTHIYIYIYTYIYTCIKYIIIITLYNLNEFSSREMKLISYSVQNSINSYNFVYIYPKVFIDMNIYDRNFDFIDTTMQYYI